MREIKFRAWHKGGFMLEAVSLVDIAGNVDDWGERLLGGYGNLTIMQFTGLHDKNGKEIWEGDWATVRYTSEGREYDSMSGKVQMSERGYWHIFNKKRGEGMALYAAEEIEVLGNIYENPELLK